MVRVKICGLRRPQDIAAVNALVPAYVGFVFAPHSRRCVDAAQAAELRQALATGICPVGVFVDAPQAQILALLKAGTIAAVQLHGHETPEYVTALQCHTGAPIIQAFRVESAADVYRAAQSKATYILLDNGAGGTGQSFDWTLIRGLRRPYFLAGGLGAHNVWEAVMQCQPRPFAVDSSSLLESNGLKDAEKMRQFMAAVANIPE